MRWPPEMRTPSTAYPTICWVSRFFLLSDKQRDFNRSVPTSQGSVVQRVEWPPTPRYANDYILPSVPSSTQRRQPPLVISSAICIHNGMTTCSQLCVQVQHLLHVAIECKSCKTVQTISRCLPSMQLFPPGFCEVTRKVITQWE